jgi:ParB family chromosome partitioning protein
MTAPETPASKRKRAGLGRGLDALLQSSPTEPRDRAESGTGDAESRAAGMPREASVMELPTLAIRPNPYQPRQHFDSEALDELTASIREHGLIQPLLVKREGSEFVLIAGERRWQAAQAAGLQRVPVVVREASDREMLALAIIENVQRADLNPIESAAGYRRLMDEFELTQTEVARLVGKSRTALANTLRLLGLAPDVQQLLSAGHISEGHARALLGIGDAAEQLALAKRIIADAWTVRRTESAVRDRVAILDGKPGAEDVSPANSGAASQPATTAVAPDPDTRAAIVALERALGTRVEIRRRGAGGQLLIYFYSEEELAALYDRLT